MYLKTYISSHHHARIRILLLLFLRFLVVLRIFVQFLKQTFEFGLVFGYGPLYSVMNIHSIAQSLFQRVQNVSVNVVKLQSFVLPQVSLVIVEKLLFDFGRRLPAGLFFGIGLLHPRARYFSNLSPIARRLASRASSSHRLNASFCSKRSASDPWDSSSLPLDDESSST